MSADECNEGANIQARHDIGMPVHRGRQRSKNDGFFFDGGAAFTGVSSNAGRALGRSHLQPETPASVTLSAQCWSYEVFPLT
jgi:hypothetical protein